MKIQGIVFDWAGTIVDFGSLAPMGAFVKLFASHKIHITIAQARIPMGLPKLAHIEALGAMPEIAMQWKLIKGKAFSKTDANNLLKEFEPMSAQAAIERSDFIPGFLSIYARLREKNIGVATTTGYTRKIMIPLIARALENGFDPARVICCDDVARSRPDPMGMYACFESLHITEPRTAVKVDDTAPGLQEGLNAGCWTVGVSTSGNALGWSLDKWNIASDDERNRGVVAADRSLIKAGAHEVIRSVADLPEALERINARIDAGEKPTIQRQQNTASTP